MDHPDDLSTEPISGPAWEPVRISAGAAAAIAVRPMPKEAINSLAAAAAEIAIRRAAEADAARPDQETARGLIAERRQ